MSPDTRDIKRETRGSALFRDLNFRCSGLRRPYETFNSSPEPRRQCAGDRDTTRAIDFFIDSFVYPETIIFYMGTIKPYSHPNRLSIIFPARLCWVLCDIVELN